MSIEKNGTDERNKRTLCTRQTVTSSIVARQGLENSWSFTVNDHRCAGCLESFAYLLLVSHFIPLYPRPYNLSPPRFLPLSFSLPVVIIIMCVPRDSIFLIQLRDERKKRPTTGRTFLAFIFVNYKTHRRPANTNGNWFRGGSVGYKDANGGW